MEVGNGSPVSSLRMEVVWQPQGYLALRVWVRSGLPLHRRSHRSMPPNQFSVSSLQALKEQECKQKGGGWGGHSGRVDMEREKNTKHNSSMFVHVKHFKTFWEKQVVNGLKTLSEGGGSHSEMAIGWQDRQCFGRPIKRKDGIVGRVKPPQSESSIAPENHEREEKKREKHKNTKRGEIHVSEEIKKATTQTPQTDHVPEHRGGGLR